MPLAELLPTVAVAFGLLAGALLVLAIRAVYRGESSDSRESSPTLRAASVDITDVRGVNLLGDVHVSPPGIIDLPPVGGEERGTLDQGEESDDTEFEGDKLTDLERVCLQDLLNDLYPSEEDATDPRVRWVNVTPTSRKYFHGDNFEEDSGELGLGASAATTAHPSGTDPYDGRIAPGSRREDPGIPVAWHPSTSWVFAGEETPVARVSTETAGPKDTPTQRTIALPAKTEQHIWDVIEVIHQKESRSSVGLEEIPPPTNSPESPLLHHQSHPEPSRSPSPSIRDLGPMSTTCSSSPTSTFELPGSPQKERPSWTEEERQAHATEMQSTVPYETSPSISPSSQMPPTARPTKGSEQQSFDFGRNPEGQETTLSTMRRSLRTSSSRCSMRTARISQSTTGDRPAKRDSDKKPEQMSHGPLEPADSGAPKRLPVTMPNRPPLSTIMKEVMRDIKRVLTELITVVPPTLNLLTWDNMYEVIAEDMMSDPQWLLSKAGEDYLDA
ncbi:uncharacterized protein EV420DRAFT_1476183 [Desarmillaria tabescens]|uniref:Uncharacterized protein n=1 Tax=Armillaria tabescens TaxID=1929756 RepID=A0AA39ND71_ARMTA|nr:uncharacterized protein EV420DRAFT_1476183 [Desarmillaria tabescens]KAK0463445.1 hypothetical protein EV420DRAFT_1476183 [Desarmillaria tabescens]